MYKTRTTTRSCRDPETAVSNFYCFCRRPRRRLCSCRRRAVCGDLLLVCVDKVVVSN